MLDILSVFYLIALVLFMMSDGPQIPMPRYIREVKPYYLGYGTALVVLVVISGPALVNLTETKIQALHGFVIISIIGLCSYFNYRSKCLR